MLRTCSLGAFACFLAGCFSPELGPTPFTCAVSPRCPEGYSCIAGVCRRGSPTADLFLPGDRDLTNGDLRRADRRRDGPAADQRSTDRPTRDSRPGVPGTWVLIPAGSFMMGSPASEPCRQSDEIQHQVTLTHSFEIMTTEVTQANVQEVMGSNWAQNQSCGPSCPMEMTSWSQAAAYLNALSQMVGAQPCYVSCPGLGCAEAPAFAGNKIYSCPGFRFPTEAEWEYAYRAGTTTAYYSGPNDPAQCNETTPTDANLSKIAWYVTSGTHPVAQKQANSWGLHDTAGNVWEWVHDWYGPYAGSGAVSDPVGPAAGNQRVARGGAFNNDAQHARAAHRGQFAPVIDGKLAQYIEIGFRAARTR